jgi:hypothetical protein
LIDPLNQLNQWRRKENEGSADNSIRIEDIPVKMLPANRTQLVRLR